MYTYKYRLGYKSMEISVVFLKYFSITVFWYCSTYKSWMDLTSVVLSQLHCVSVVEQQEEGTDMVEKQLFPSPAA